MPDDCPVCGLQDCRRQRHPRGGPDTITCNNCGEFILTKTAETVLAGESPEALQRAALSHAVWKLTQAAQPAMLYEDIIEAVLKAPSLPTPAEQADLAVLWWGDNFRDPGAEQEVRPAEFAARIGAIGEDGVLYVLDHLNRKNLLWVREWDKGRPSGSQPKGAILKCRLTFDGWQKYEDLQKGRADTRKVFMAMPFSGDYAVSVKEAYRAFQGAVAQTGFYLVNGLLDTRKAGLIDNHLRVEIRTAHFVISDLTGGNHGAYWEAGFGEGLGKTVIYTCEKGFFEKNRTHFDTSHCQTVIWEGQNLCRACDELKAIIRNTFLGQAKMTDDHEEEKTLHAS